MVHNIPELHVAPDVALEVHDADAAQLLASRRLVLLFDLDQTLIHTTDEATKVSTTTEDIHQYGVPGIGKPYTTKIRPHTREVLRRLAERFELHICTFGNRMYAHKIATILDPKPHPLFGHRILSRDECFDARHKTPNLQFRLYGKTIQLFMSLAVPSFHAATTW